jgi:hypothetical protein
VFLKGYLPVAVRSPVAPVEDQDDGTSFESLREVKGPPLLIGQLEARHPLPDLYTGARLGHVVLFDSAGTPCSVYPLIYEWERRLTRS